MSTKKIKKVYIQPGCISCGTCESICPRVFKVNDVAHVIENADYNRDAESIREAAEVCPVTVIQYEEE